MNCFEDLRQVSAACFHLSVETSSFSPCSPCAELLNICLEMATVGSNGNLFIVFILVTPFLRDVFNPQEVGMVIQVPDGESPVGVQRIKLTETFLNLQRKKGKRNNERRCTT